MTDRTIRNGLLNWIVVLTVAQVGHAAWANDADDDAGSSGDFYEDRSEGWHWYEDPPPVEEEELKEIVPQSPVSAPSSTQESAEPMTTEWLRTMLPQLRDAAIDSPTNENVAAYFYAQRIMFDKAQVFSDKAQQVVNSDPLLDEDLRLPFARGSQSRDTRGGLRSKARAR